MVLQKYFEINLLLVKIWFEATLHKYMNRAMQILAVNQNDS